MPGCVSLICKCVALIMYNRRPATWALSLLLHCQLCDSTQIPLDPAGLYSPCGGRGTDENMSSAAPLQQWLAEAHYSSSCASSCSDINYFCITGPHLGISVVHAGNARSSLGCLSRAISHKTKSLPILSKDMSPPHLPSNTLQPKQ